MNERNYLIELFLPEPRSTDAGPGRALDDADAPVVEPGDRRPFGNRSETVRCFRVLAQIFRDHAVASRSARISHTFSKPRRSRIGLDIRPACTTSAGVPRRTA